jgi:hypothetical protein
MQSKRFRFLVISSAAIDCGGELRVQYGRLVNGNAVKRRWSYAPVASIDRRRYKIRSTSIFRPAGGRRNGLIRELKELLPSFQDQLLMAWIWPHPLRACEQIQCALLFIDALEPMQDIAVVGFHVIPQSIF